MKDPTPTRNNKNKNSNTARSILTAHYKLHKLNDTLTLFEQLFCINNAIAKICNGKLQILLQ